MGCEDLQSDGGDYPEECGFSASSRLTLLLFLSLLNSQPPYAADRRLKMPVSFTWPT